MSKLAALLRNKPSDISPNTGKKTTKLFMEKNEDVVVSPATDGLSFDISEAELEQIRASIVEIDTTDKNRQQIVIGMYGSIKNPRTGKRFVIPGVDFTSDDYSYQYAEMMRLLVNRPDDFKKIMNWE